MQRPAQIVGVVCLDRHAQRPEPLDFFVLSAQPILLGLEFATDRDVELLLRVELFAQPLFVRVRAREILAQLILRSAGRFDAVLERFDRGVVEPRLGRGRSVDRGPGLREIPCE